MTSAANSHIDDSFGDRALASRNALLRMIASDPSPSKGN